MKRSALLILISILVGVVAFNSVARFSSLPDGSDQALWPARYFRAVYRACLEVSNDLDVVTNIPELQKEWCETDYLLDQFLYLYTNIANLTTDKDEARTYLREDALFLIELMHAVGGKYRRLVDNQREMDPVILLILALLVKKCEQRIEDLLRLNQEVTELQIYNDGFSDVLLVRETVPV